MVVSYVLETTGAWLEASKPLILEAAAAQYIIVSILQTMAMGSAMQCIAITAANSVIFQSSVKETSASPTSTICLHRVNKLASLELTEF